MRALFADPAAFDAWAARWRAALAADDRPPEAVAAAMDRVNPVYIPRNHLVEDALAAATGGDLEPFRRLLDVLARPFDERPGSRRTPCRPRPSTGPVPHVLRHLTARGTRPVPRSEPGG